VFLHYEECLEDDLQMTIKLTLPKSWKSGPAQRLVDTFVEAYNKKHPDSKLDESEVHFEKKDGFVVPFDAPVDSFMESQEDLFLKKGVSKSMESLGFTPKEKESESVAKAPVAKPKSSIAAAVASANRALPKTNTSAGVAKNDGKLPCKHFGCNKRYLESENADGACKYHEKPPVFHETKKWWACCPDKVAWDWDSFTDIPGCCTGRHTNEAQGKQFLGGADVRKDLEDAHSAPRSLSKKAEKTSLDKLGVLRRALVDLGVDGAVFDQARDKVKASLEEEHGEKVWDEVVKALSVRFGTMLQGIN